MEFCTPRRPTWQEGPQGRTIEHSKHVPDRLAHEQRGQYDQAEVWRRKWLAAVKEKAGPESAAYAAEVKRLVRLYDAWGKPEAAAEWRKELETRRPRAASPSRE